MDNVLMSQVLYDVEKATGQKITTVKQAERYLQGITMDIRTIKTSSPKSACVSCNNVMKYFKVLDFNK